MVYVDKNFEFEVQGVDKQDNIKILDNQGNEIEAKVRFTTDGSIGIGLRNIGRGTYSLFVNNVKLDYIRLN